MLVDTMQVGGHKLLTVIGDAISNEIFAQAEDFNDTAWANIHQVLRVPIRNEVRSLSPDLPEVLC